MRRLPFFYSFLFVNEYIRPHRWYTKKSMHGSVFMRYRSLKIGTGPGNDLHLATIGHCTQVSDNHAIIFFDEVSFVTFD